jgi:hypothetical protein
LRGRTNTSGNRTVLRTNWILLNTTDGEDFLRCLDSRGVLECPPVVPKGLTRHEARARRVGSYTFALVDRLNVVHHPQLLSDRLQITRVEL